MAELNLKQIVDRLNAEFTGDTRKLVFWYDDKAEFEEDMESVELENAKVYRLQPDNQFQTKYYLERIDTTTNYLIYAPFPKPDIKDNHLEDTMLYSKRFYADRASLLSVDLGIDEKYKYVIEKHIKFFAYKDKTQRFYDLGIENFNEENILIGLLSALCKIKICSFEEVVCIVLTESGLDENSYLEEFEEYDLLSAFWKLCEQQFGYSDDKPTLEKLVVTMFVTYTERYLQGDIPKSWNSFSSTKPGNIIAFLDNLMNNVLYRDKYDELSKHVASGLNVTTALSGYEIADLLNCDTFIQIDEFIEKWIVDRLVAEDTGAKVDELSIPQICDMRSKMHFGPQLTNQYNMLCSAYQIISEVNYQPIDGFKAVIREYVEKDWMVDQEYRKFYFYYDRIEDTEHYEMLKTLVENIYTNVYLGKQLPNWNQAILEEDSFLQLPLQRRFFEKYVRNAKERTVVIISDAMRYEVGKELFIRMQDDPKCTAKIEPMLSTLPSYTKLGMAALLPNKQLSITDSFQVLVDGQSCDNLASRQKTKAEGKNEMVEFMETDDKRTVIKEKLRQCFDGLIVRKDLTKSIREGANVPVYVLEYLLGQYCNSDDQEIIDAGIENVKRILRDNYVRPDEAQKILSLLREHGSYTIIDKITVILNTKEDRYEASFSNLGIKGIPIHPDYVKDYDRLLCGGIWCILRLEYEFIEEDKKNTQPIRVRSLKPIQMPHVDMDELKSGRKAFTKEEWIDVVLRSIGMEPEKFTDREKWLLLARMVPLVENNYNLCELGPRSTGKSYVYEQISPNSILVAGGQTTVANLFYDMSKRQVGLVGMWDCVAFDEVAGIKFKDKDGVQIMKGYMASGSFSRGKAEIQAKASMVFVGNINQSVETLLKTSSLFDPFPPEMGMDTAFLDRMHAYVPGWEIPKYRPDFFTDDYGFITDYLSEFMRELRKDSCADLMDKYFRLGNNLNQRDTIAVRKTVSGLIKLVYPDGEAGKEEIREILELALELRRRVKEQLKKIGGMEFYDVNFSYIETEDFEEKYVSVPESGGGKLIPEGMGKPGSVYFVGKNKGDMIGCFHLETQMMPGNGKLTMTGLGSNAVIKQGPNTAFNYLKANGNSISGQISTTTKDYIVAYQDLQGIGMTESLALPTLIAISSAALSKPPVGSLAILGDITIGGTLVKVENLASTLQVCLDSGAKKVLLPLPSANDLGTVPADLVGAFSLIFYASPTEAVFKALGVE